MKSGSSGVEASWFPFSASHFGGENQQAAAGGAVERLAAAAGRYREEVDVRGHEGGRLPRLVSLRMG